MRGATSLFPSVRYVATGEICDVNSDLISVFAIERNLRLPRHSARFLLDCVIRCERVVLRWTEYTVN